MKVLKLSSADRQVVAVVFSAIPSVGPDELELNNEIIEGLKLDAIVSTTLATGEGDQRVVHNLGPSEIDDIEYMLTDAAYKHLVQIFQAWGRFKGDVEKQKKAAHAWIRIEHPEAKSYAELVERIDELEFESENLNETILSLQTDLSESKIEIAKADDTLKQTIDKSNDMLSRVVNQNADELKKTTDALQLEHNRVAQLEARIIELCNEIDKLRNVEVPKPNML